MSDPSRSWDRSIRQYCILKRSGRMGGMWKSDMMANFTSALYEPYVQRMYMRDSISGVSGISLTRGICFTKCVPCFRDMPGWKT